MDMGSQAEAVSIYREAILQLKLIRKLLLIFSIIIATTLLCAFFFRQPIRAAYHSWRMNTEFNTIFGDPQPVGNGLASHDVTDTDVEAVMQSYEFHRRRLVELGVLAHVTASFPMLASDGSTARSDARSAFVRRMGTVFPSHRHYSLSGDGSFSAWVPVDDTERWNEFLDSESSRMQ